MPRRLLSRFYGLRAVSPQCRPIWPPRANHKVKERTVADVALVLLTVGLFVVLALVVRAVERL